MKGLRGKVSDLEKAAAQRKAKLDENSAFLQFNWKADVVESWIGMFCTGVFGHRQTLNSFISKGSSSCTVVISRPKPRVISSANPLCFCSNPIWNRGNV